MQSLSAALYWRESTASQIGLTRRSGMPPASPNLLAMSSRNLGLGFWGCGAPRVGKTKRERSGRGAEADERRVYRVGVVTARRAREDVEDGDGTVRGLKGWDGITPVGLTTGGRRSSTGGNWKWLLP